MKRPYPPEQDNPYADDEDLIDSGGLLHFEPANNDLWPWIEETFLCEWGKLHNPDHEHLLSFQPPEISFLWAYAKCEAKDKRVYGQTEKVMINVGGWRKQRQELQLINWFGDIPKYIITLDARVCQVMSDTDFCALVEHELYHIGHKKNKDSGEFEYTSVGEPRLYLRGHDVEEFHGVVQRYGASEEVQKMVNLANEGPTISRANIAHACGTCLLKLA
ncbi:TPA: putative metallopeptidase [Acinetobacter baumannii]|uniref:putative metallopeptidase n=1 Tax=Acinetobacter calcoaceticus/baumannii complex TaxID=909768 RepID=UPI000BDCB332|nr:MULTISPECIES: putative metallopeptidase [Acinetobacter calcoaceticus/baumannii complex]HAV4234119.1 transposase [Acinetobacter baumannii ATCC 17978]MBR7714444.1 transposase [Acinetobacter nosocomialis]MCJ9206336.1 transposase [Acinetobacter baumannii]MCJ9332136.1 transposase [Acinetobacter baumannii]MCJ9527940.1 transposase [Acinetobacter baumannii]